MPFLHHSGNDIGEEGIKALTLAIGYQTSLSQFHSSAKPGNMGLMRLVVHVSTLTLGIVCDIRNVYSRNHSWDIEVFEWFYGLIIPPFSQSSFWGNPILFIAIQYTVCQVRSAYATSIDITHGFLGRTQVVTLFSWGQISYGQDESAETRLCWLVLLLRINNEGRSKKKPRELVNKTLV